MSDHDVLLADLAAETLRLAVWKTTSTWPQINTPL